jgi:predicted nucleic acid-binding Zn ribbon protein
MEEKVCLDCGTPIKVGRSDKKFCDNTCRTNYNNRQKEQKQSTEVSLPPFIVELNQILVTNWKILKDCIGGKDTCRMRVRDLSGRGFNFKYFTSERLNDYNDDVYYFCYDMGYKFVTVNDEQKVVIVQNEQMVRLTGPAFPVTETDRLG